MNLRRSILLPVAVMLFLAMAARGSYGQATAPGKPYKEMTPSEQMAFVVEQAARITRELSGADYQFTPAFTSEIKKSVDAYARRIGNGGGDQLGKGDARFIFERGKTYAPALVRTFTARNVSPLIGLYLPWIESEFVNIQSPNSVGAIGMFQFLPKTGEHYGLTAAELLDVEKSADAAARYIAAGLKRFHEDPMKEALALLAYNRGATNVERDLAMVVNQQSRACSICALTEQRARLDSTFQSENVYYVPRFFAAAIVGENPLAFGLGMEPLSQALH